METLETALANTPQADFAAPGQAAKHAKDQQAMLQLVDARNGNAALVVGAGSAWTTAVLARVVGPTGKVLAVEKQPKLVASGNAALKRLGIHNAQIFVTGPSFGLAAYAPYDRILAHAHTAQLPRDLAAQLLPGGKMIVLVNTEILEVIKKATGQLEIVPHPIKKQ